MISDHLSATFAALADPTRRAILARLVSGETTVTELAVPFAMSLPAVTKHLKVLQRAGLISQSRQAQWRPCKLEPKPLAAVADYVEQYRRLWEQNLDRLGDYLHELKVQPAVSASVRKSAKKSSGKAVAKPTAKTAAKIPLTSLEKKHGRKKS